MAISQAVQSLDAHQAVGEWSEDFLVVPEHEESGKLLATLGVTGTASLRMAVEAAPGQVVQPWVLTAQDEPAAPTGTRVSQWEATQ